MLNTLLLFSSKERQKKQFITDTMQLSRTNFGDYHISRNIQRFFLVTFVLLWSFWDCTFVVLYY